MKQKTIDLFRKLAQKYLAPIPKVRVSDWADEYRIISKGNAYEGKWRTSFAPYQKEIMDAFTQGGVNKVVVMSASQIGKSDIMNNVIGRFAHLDPCPIMMVQPTDSMAQDYSKSRISPMVRDTEVLNGLFADPKSRDSSSTILNKIFPGGRLIMTGSNSPSQLASRPIRILLCDEVDRFEASAGTEGSPIALAEKRLTTFWNRLTALFSTPTIKGFSRIEAEYKLGTQEEWQHQCPNCKEFHLLNYRHMDWKADEIETRDKEKEDVVKLYIVHEVNWRCPDCGFSFSEEIMKAQPQNYVVKNPEALKNNIRSFLVNGFAPYWINWKEIIKEYLIAQHDENDLKVVYNTRFAESYEVKGHIDNVQPFVEGREDYYSDLPNGVLILTAAVDTQDNRLEYEICGWGEDEECWGIEKGVILGSPDQASTWTKLDDILDRTYYYEDGKGLMIARTFIDSGGHYTEEVYKYCLKNYYRQRIAIKGSSNFIAPLIEKYSKTQNYNIPLVILGVSQGKQYVFDRLLKNDGLNAHRFHFPKDDNRGYTLTYFKGLVSERLIQKKNKGRLILVWENISSDGRNEPLDLRVYNLACLKSINPNWEKYKNHINGIKENKKPAKKQNDQDYGYADSGGGWLDA